MSNFRKLEPAMWETMPMTAQAARQGKWSRLAGFSSEILRVGVRVKVGLVLLTCP